jgi:hypothetical protein
MKVIKIKAGEPIPENAKFIAMTTEKEVVSVDEFWAPTQGIMGVLPIFGTETLYRHTKYKDVDYYHYEVENPGH